MKNSDFEKLNKKFYNLLCWVFSDYYLWLSMRDFFNLWTDTSKFMGNRYKEFFVPVLFALQDKFMLGLANLLDWIKKSTDKKVVSIFELLEFVENKEDKLSIIEILNNNDKIKNKLFKWRNKSIAHKDYKLWIEGYENFIKEYHLEFNDIFKIMIKTWEVYDKIYNSVNNTKQMTGFDSLNNNFWFQKLINDIKYFVPINDDERILLMTKK